MFLMAAMCEDECDTCQSSIDHMYDKIDAQGCNPNTMQKAWDQIREDCDHSSSAVGLMAETCTFGRTAKPGCNLPSLNVNDHYTSILLDHGQVFSDDVYNIVINVQDQSYIFEVKYDESADHLTRFILEDLVISEGDIFEVIVEHIDEDGIAQEIGKETQIFTFARNGLWEHERLIFFTSLEPDERTEINFVAWEGS